MKEVMRIFINLFVSCQEQIKFIVEKNYDYIRKLDITYEKIKQDK